MVDGYLGKLDATGAAIVLTADHGMKPKHDGSGAPQVVYIQDVLDEWLGRTAARVILPIADPYVVHHGALGSFATVAFHMMLIMERSYINWLPPKELCLPSTKRLCTFRVARRPDRGRGLGIR